MDENHFKEGENHGAVVARLDSIDRSLAEFKCGMGKRIEKMEDVIAQNSTIITQHEEKMKSLDVRVSDWEISKRWILRIVMGSVIMALLGMVIKGHFK